MKLIFNKNSEDPKFFPREFKETLGYVDADFRFEKIAPDLRSATRTLIAEIGQETYNKFVEVYQGEKENPTEKEIEALKLAQNAIANAAYRLFAPSNDLQHGVNGRKMLTTEDSKTPFEHLLVASNDEMERRTFRAMDDLLNYLDENMEDWKTTDAYKATHRNFLRTVTEFNQFFMIESRYLLQKLAPGLALAEKREIVPRIGKETYESLKEKRTNAEALNAEEEILLNHIQEATAYYALAWGVTRLQASIFPDGIYYKIRSDRNTISGKTPPSGNQVDQMEQQFIRDAKSAFMEIERLVEPKEENTNSHTISERDRFGFDTCDNFVS